MIVTKRLKSLRRWNVNTSWHWHQFARTVTLSSPLMSNDTGASKGGYIILAPDLPSDTAENNQMLYLPKEEETPKYSLLTPMKCFRAYIKNVILFNGCIDEIEEISKEDSAMEKTFDEIYSKIEDNLVPVDYSLSVINSLNSNYHSRYRFRERDICDIQRSAIIAENRRLMSNSVYKYMREFDANKSQLNKYQQRIVEKYIIEGKLNGRLLEKSEAERFDKIYKEYDEKSKKFAKNVNTAIARFKQEITDKSFLKYFPDDVLRSLGATEKLTVTLIPEVYHPFMEYYPDDQQRFNVWRAFNGRASHVVDQNISNTFVLEDIRTCRKNMARVLGFGSYVEMTMITKMAQSMDTVYSMIDNLNEKNMIVVNDDIKELTDFINESSIKKYEKLELWDLPYWSRRLIEAKYPVNNNIVRQYFPLPNVLNGLFGLVKKLFDVNIEEVQQKHFDAWHKDVRLFRIISPKGFLGSFFFDPYLRLNDKKITKPRVELILNRCEKKKIKPLSNLIASFQRPLTDKCSSQLSFEEVLMLFRNFGYILQHSLNEMPFHEISGLNNLEWDRVQFVPEFMELWLLHDYSVAQSCSGSANDGTPLPLSLFKTIRERNLKFSGFRLQEELYKSALDLELHTSDEAWIDVKQEVWRKYMKPFEVHRHNHHVCSFTELFCENSAGSYYSKTWAKMLAADAFLAFKETKEEIENDIRTVGNRFHETVLSLGGGYSGKEVFRLFRGRDPSPDALTVVNNLFGEKQLDRSGSEAEVERVLRTKVDS